QQCLEWLPYVNLADLRVHYGGTGTINQTVDFRRLRMLGTQMRDVIHWRCHGGGRITVMLLIQRRQREPAVREGTEQLVKVLVSNFPRLLYAWVHRNELLMQATPEDHPSLSQYRRSTQLS
ncbi:hypothetical protein JG688_00018644, partial [Phytophthora aleatoria]